VAAFYPSRRCFFYRVGRFHCGGFIIVFLRLVRSELKKVVHWMSEILFAAEFAADPGGATAKLLFVVGSLGKEDGAEIAIAEAIDGELTVIDG
jgi:hypothetical protein